MTVTGEWLGIYGQKRPLRARGFSYSVRTHDLVVFTDEEWKKIRRSVPGGGSSKELKAAREQGAEVEKVVYKRVTTDVPGA